MIKDRVKLLVKESYTDGTLDENKVLSITETLKRSELKAFIKEVKKLERKRTVIVATPYIPNDNEKRSLADLFPGKDLEFLADQSLLTGLKIINDDLITDISLKEKLKKISDYLEESYD